MSIYTPTMPVKVSRTAVYIVVAIVIVAAFVALGLAIGLTVSRVKRRARVDNIPLVERASPRHVQFVPQDRVPLNKLPRGVSRTVVSNHPILDKLDNFLSPEEADHLIAIAQSRFKRSVVVDPATSKLIENKDRTSSSTFLERGEDDIVKAIEARASQASGVPPQYFERLQVVRYQPGQFYRAHHDYIDGATKEVAEHGQRTLTMFVYLNDLPDDETGGGTNFPHLKHTVRPKKGSAALWHNMTPAGNVDPRTLHSGEPLQKSEKYGLNIWARDRPQVPVLVDNQVKAQPAVLQPTTTSVVQ